MFSKIGATFQLIAFFAVLIGANYFIEHGLPNVSSLPVSPSVSSALVVGSPSPKFKVEHRSYLEERQTQCGRNLCPSIQVPVMRLKIQSLMRVEVRAYLNGCRL